MKKFIYKSIYFVFPFFSIYLLNILCFNPREGDLVRLGYIYSNPLPTSEIASRFSLKKEYTLVSELNIKPKRKFQVLTVGDSFSEQDSLGYKNFLADEGFDVLHLDRSLCGSNPFQSIVQMINVGFFNFVNTDYVVLQSVERDFVPRLKEIDFTKSISTEFQGKNIFNVEKKTPSFCMNLFSDETLKIPLTNIQYFYTNKPKYSKTYMFPLKNDGLFSNHVDELLVYKGDINSLEFNNDSSKISQCVSNLEIINEMLIEKNIELIVLIAPDKYDLYYPYIENNQNYTKPLFFNIYNSLQKNYLSVNSYEILSEELKKDKDLYLYDDSHWSPIASKRIAEELKTIIKNNEAQRNSTR